MRNYITNSTQITADLAEIQAIAELSLKSVEAEKPHRRIGFKQYDK